MKETKVRVQKCDFEYVPAEQESNRRHNGKYTLSSLIRQFAVNVEKMEAMACVVWLEECNGVPEYWDLLLMQAKIEAKINEVYEYPLLPPSLALSALHV